MSNVCGRCGHSLEDNQHGPDQNDLTIDEHGHVHWESCTYCKECNPAFAEAIQRADQGSNALHLSGACRPAPVRANEAPEVFECRAQQCEGAAGFVYLPAESTKIKIGEPVLVTVRRIP